MKLVSKEWLERFPAEAARLQKRYGAAVWDPAAHAGIGAMRFGPAALDPVAAANVGRIEATQRKPCQGCGEGWRG